MWGTFLGAVVEAGSNGYLCCAQCDKWIYEAFNTQHADQRPCRRQAGKQEEEEEEEGEEEEEEQREEEKELVLDHS